MKRPGDIAHLLPVVESLATYGVVRLSGEMAEWLQEIGVVDENSQNALSIPTEHWLRYAVPAIDHRDLLRKTALCDPLYRQYLDLTIASILHIIGKTERWARYEELLFGQFKSFAPRFVQLLAWLALRFDKDPKLITDNDWLSVASEELLQHKDKFNRWNEYLWGTAETPSALFPLLGDMYVPLLNVPVHISSSSDNVDETQKRLLLRLIQATQQADGIIVEHNDQNCLFSMIANGLPVRVWPTGAEQLKAGIVGNVVVTMPAAAVMQATEATQLPVAMPSVSAEIATTDTGSHAGPADLWSIIGSCRKTYVFYSLDLRTDKWPDESLKEIPENYAVPSLSLLRDAGKSRSATPQVDVSLQWLGDHPLYGFLLQLLLLEALDRELGDETLVLVPGTLRDDNDWCDEASTRVVYEPRAQAGGAVNELRLPAYDLGTIDTVLSQLSRTISIDRIVHPYALRKCGPWSTAFKLLRQAEVISDRYNRWSLAEHILDRLYGGGLMTSVIRRGKEMRETLHISLKELWDGKERLQKNREVHGE